MISLRALFHHSAPFFPLNMRWCSYLGKGNPKNYGDMIIDSAIIGGIGFFSSLIAALATNSGLPSTLSLYAAGLAFGMAFLSQLASERRIKTRKKEIV
jgi:hypothetical protein